MMKLYSHLTDQELLALLKSGDEAGYTEIYNRYWDKAFVMATHRLGSEHEAEELVQELFFSIWKRRERLAIEHSLLTYLSVAIKYQVINFQAKRYRKELVLATHFSVEEQGEDTTQLWFNERELTSRLHKEISRLPEKCQLVFRMSREQEKTNKEIAADLGISEKTVEAHITKAISTLKNKLELSLPLVLYLLKR